MTTPQRNYQLPTPLLVPVLLWTLGIVFSRFVNVSFGVLAGVAAFAFLVGVLFGKSRCLLIPVLFLLMGAIRHQISIPEASQFQETLEERGYVLQQCEFQILSRLSNNSYTANLYKVNNVGLDEKLFVNSIKPLTPGTSYRALLEITPIKRDPVLDIYTSKYAAKGAVVGAVETLESKQNHIAKLREYLLQRVDLSIGESSGLAKALLFSDSELKHSQRLLLSRAGITHLVVVSGLHVVFLFYILMTLLKIVFPRSWAELMFLIAACLFAALNNWAAPITRAIVMICIGVFARWLSRPLSIIQNLASSVFIITLINPTEVFGVGFQLSVIAVGIIGIIPKSVIPTSSDDKHKHIYELGNRIGRYILLTTAVSIGISPLTLYYFGSASLNGILGNLLGIPLIALLLPLSLVLLIIPGTSMIGSKFLLSYNLLNSVWEEWLRICSSLPLHIENRWISLGQSLALAMLIAIFFVLLKRKYQLGLKLALIFGLVFALQLLLPRADSSRIHVFNAGVADCALIQIGKDTTIMIDTGGLRGFAAEKALTEKEYNLEDSWMQRRLVPWMQRRRIRDIDYLVLTHLHTDHIGGLPALMNSVRVKIIFLSDNSLKDELWQQLSTSLELGSTTIHCVQDTISYDIKGAKLKFLHPDKEFYRDDANNLSIVCRLDFRGVRYLFTGDIEQDAEEYLFHKYPQEIKADYLKVAHHGSRTSSSNEFLRMVSPEEAWITTSRSNIYGFPHPEALERLGRYTSKLRSTADGTILHFCTQND